MKTSLSRGFGSKGPQIAALCLSLVGLLALHTPTWAQEAAKPAEQAKPAEKPKYPPFAEVLKDAKPSADPSLIKMYQKGEQLFAELNNGHLNKDFIILISIARGIGEGPLLGGMSWGFGDDWLWQFRKVDDKIQIVRHNVRFKANKGSPEERAVSLAYTDSVLFSLPIATMSPSGGMIVDLTPVFMSDLPQISTVLPGYMFAYTKSTWDAVKGFKDNVELRVAATYVPLPGHDGINSDSVADNRGVSLGVHYSISLLPQTGYTSRLADDRVGYFLTALKDYSKKGEEDQFVRYINRWHLVKADPAAELSPPKEPIRFYIEKTVPFPYRKPIRDGILEWNKAFEKAGFIEAIHVIQQRDEETWDPEDINYNTFRWITSSAGFAMGPSRVNPGTGQILDADIIFDADFVRYWKDEYETFTPTAVAAMTGGALDLKSYQEEIKKVPPHLRHRALCRCDLHSGMAHELALGSAALAGRFGAEAKGMQEEMVMQGLKEVTMHEVGHTLGLRHNFKSSSVYTLDELTDPAKTKANGMTASVMDYSPAYIVPKDMKQGDFFSSTIGPYDTWAIEYGYKVVSGGSPEGEKAELQKIAARCAAPELAYATDEDTRGIDSDPLANRYDLGKDPLAYARLRAKLIGELWPDMVNRVTKDGDGYQRARQAFGVLLGNYGRAMHFASRNVGGMYVNRDHKADPNGRPPFVIVEPQKQRDSMALLEEQVFSDKPFQFPPDLYNYMAASRWSHWGTDTPARLDLPVHEVISMWQDRILQQLMSSLTMERLHDSELKVAADQDAFTTIELIDRLTKSIFSELDGMPSGDFTTRKPAVSSLRRNLQRIYVKRLANLALGETGAPQDCQTVAFVALEDLEAKINKLLANPDTKLDPYSRAHLKETASRVHKVIDSSLEITSP